MSILAFAVLNAALAAAAVAGLVALMRLPLVARDPAPAVREREQAEPLRLAA